METLHQPTLERLSALPEGDTAEFTATRTKDILDVIAYLTEHHNRGFEPAFFVNTAFVLRVK